MPGFYPGPVTNTPTDGAAAELEREIRRVADRLTAMSAVRLGEDLASGRPRAAEVRAAAEALVAIAARAEDRPAPNLPAVGAGALADVVRVTGTDVLLTDAPPEQAEAARAEALEILRDLRRRL